MPTTASTPDVMTTAEAAEYLRLSGQYLRLLRSGETGPAYCRVGNRVRYRREDLDFWLKGRREGGPIAA